MSLNHEADMTICNFKVLSGLLFWDNWMFP